MQHNKKLFIVIVFVFITLWGVSLLQAKIKNPYSYLSKPPLYISSAISPDKSVYNRGEIINFVVVANLDTLRCDPVSNYLVYIGNLSSLLTQSELVGSSVQESYMLNRKIHAVKISFKVRMLNKYSPPVIAVRTVRIAQENSTNKKPFLNIAIDEFATYYLTSPAYSKVRNSDYGSTDY